MSTFAYNLMQGVDSRLAELKLIVAEAESIRDKRNDVYDLLCRAGCVIAATSLEAFIKDLHDALLSDLNSNVDTFASMPKGMQRAFSQRIVYFEGVEDDQIQRRVNQLNSFFKVNSVKIDMNAFQYKESTNRNPSTNFIDSSFFQYGINSILYCLSQSRFEAIFDGDPGTSELLRRNIRRMRSRLFRFPYLPLPGDFALQDWKPKKGTTVPTGLWHTFVEQLTRRRNAVVHADTRNNPTSADSLKSDGDKLEILFAGLTLASCSLIGSDMRGSTTDRDN